MNLSIRPRRRRGWRFRLVIIAGFLLSGLLAWRQGWLPATILANLDNSVGQYGSSTIAQLSPLKNQPISQPNPGQPAEIQVEPVVLVESTVVENPRSLAYTADLYLNSGQKHIIPWPNVGGRTKVLTYTVQSGDTVWSIADRFELDLDTLRWSNPELERNPDVLSIGTELIISPVQGVYHRVVEGDTVESIAAKYSVAVEDIVDYPPNGFYSPYELKAGTGVIVPFGRKDPVLPKPSVSADYPLAWPIVSAVSGSFAADHPGFDIGAPYGSTVYAANGGTVIYADWALDGLGYTVVIDHGSGFHTVYAHLKGTFLRAGNLVARGTPLGEVGSTGHSSGPHVHFEVRVNEKPLDPRDFLPAQPQ